MNAEFEMSPTDYDEGRDFKIVKVKKGDWANYEPECLQLSVAEPERR